MLTRIYANVEEQYTPRDVLNILRKDKKFDRFTDLQLKKYLFAIIVKKCKPISVGGMALMDLEWCATHKPQPFPRIYKLVPSFDDFITNYDFKTSIGESYKL